ncbi:GNAT family N-acetyltransferase [Pontibacter akesuensis]|uniref:Ribosomal protein S18 acetylase RimI n=1 Tax=Pontibacter akesuensis TaxID=388950 RepID=A0A1I7JJN6_9BACT|nr:GNAT family N-acetyltransferase [Pontibacter akesuensis]GHA69514.1 N-acetyltransferase [Pontibacter akesuensis]SFU85348.1 Ribosomal protein S18 acetylase RimI [Pontibacter akesuensis]
MKSTDSTTFHFRAGTAADAALLADLGWRTFEETFSESNDPADMAAFKYTMYSPALQAAELADPETEFVLVEASGEAIAYMKLYKGEAPMEIKGNKPLQVSRLYIAAAWLGRGLGDQLMQKALAKAATEGFDVVWLTVWEHNERAKRFYHKYGFREMGELEFILGQDVQRDLYMQLEV